MTSAIKRAVALAEKISPTKINGLSRQLELVSRKLEQSSLVQDDELFGIEEAARDEIGDRITALKIQRAQLQARVTLSTRYQLLSTEPLTWRDKNGWPKLVVFGLDSGYFEIGTRLVYDDWNLRVVGVGAEIEDHLVKIEQKRGAKTTIRFERHALPDDIQSCYADVVKKVQGMSSFNPRDENGVASGKLFKLTCHFKGLIPADARQKIIDARGLFEEVFIIAEPDKFEITETETVVVPVYKCDPLITGWDGKNLWLIDSFDTTPVEEYIKREFAVRVDS